MALKSYGKNSKTNRDRYKDNKLFKYTDLGDNKLPFEFEYDGEVVADEEPDEAEIKRALFKMRSRKAPGFSKISVHMIKVWYKVSHPKKGVEPDQGALELWANTV